MERLVAETIGDLLPLDHQELLVGAVKRVQSADRRQKIVIRQHEELVTMLPVPADDIIRRRVAVAIERVCVRVALVPAGSRRGSGLLLYRNRGADHRDEEGQRQRERSLDCNHISHIGAHILTHFIVPAPCLFTRLTIQR